MRRMPQRLSDQDRYGVSAVRARRRQSSAAPRPDMPCGVPQGEPGPTESHTRVHEPSACAARRSPGVRAGARLARSLLEPWRSGSTRVRPSRQLHRASPRRFPARSPPLRRVVAHCAHVRLDSELERYAARAATCPAGATFTIDFAPRIERRSSAFPPGALGSTPSLPLWTRAVPVLRDHARLPRQPERPSLAPTLATGGHH